MRRKNYTVENFALNYGIAVDDVLLRCWDAGWMYIIDQNSYIRVRDVPILRKLFNLPTKSELLSSKFWMEKFNFQDAEMLEFLRDRGIRINRINAKIPPKSLKYFMKKLKENDDSLFTVLNEINIVVDESTNNLKLDDVFTADIVGTVGYYSITSKDCIDVHQKLVEVFHGKKDPIDPPGVKDMNSLESAIQRPNTGFFGEEKYPTIEMKGAALLYSLIHNHPFHNGNKRTAFLTLLLHLGRNGRVVTASKSDIFRFIMELSSHKIIPYELSPYFSDKEQAEVTKWIDRHSRKIDKTTLLIKFRDLKHTLEKHGVSWEAKGGRRVLLERKQKGLFASNYKCRFDYGRDGEDVGKALLKRIRHELKLDEANGVDSISFYSKNENALISEYIKQNWKILSKLGKL